MITVNAVCIHIDNECNGLKRCFWAVLEYGHNWSMNATFQLVTERYRGCDDLVQMSGIS